MTVGVIDCSNMKTIYAYANVCCSARSFLLQKFCVGFGKVQVWLNLHTTKVSHEHSSSSA